ncbi:hypothetical protein CEXT_627701 [Caerostris extrusa]|uniref:Secreted protein n=1 Tax=Caerostris extrusa TaxID=172846 RepID=A0AAV4PX91_CAEEX|nr:hypothetical protein CEXT_627701 [Caerostris extrusa]
MDTTATMSNSRMLTISIMFAAGVKASLCTSSRPVATFCRYSLWSLGDELFICVCHSRVQEFSLGIGRWQAVGGGWENTSVSNGNDMDSDSMADSYLCNSWLCTFNFGYCYQIPLAFRMGLISDDYNYKGNRGGFI